MLDILQCCCAGKLLTKSQLELLLARELDRTARSLAFNITESNGLDKIKARSQLLSSVYPEIIELARNLSIERSDSFLLTLWHLWLPLGIELARVGERLDRTLIQGILGAQGTGKTTLTKMLEPILNRLGYSTLSISIDDLYKTYRERQLLQQQDPRLIWRGPPGTHDVELGMEVLSSCDRDSEKNTILVPRFDKSARNGAGDRAGFESVERPDIILFEGWFVGVRPIEGTIFDNIQLNPIITQKDRLFAKDSNKRLKNYLPLWKKLDSLIVLYPTDYRFSKQWRKEAEQKMKASGKSGMSDTEIDNFVEYFWCSLHPELFVKPLIKNPDLVDLVIEINCSRSIGKIYKPRDC